MKTSELIDHLKCSLSLYGDLEVLVNSGDIDLSAIFEVLPIKYHKKDMILEVRTVECED